MIRSIGWLLSALLLVNACNQIPSVSPVDLRTEKQESPQGVDRLQPRFSWKLHTPNDNVTQSAYQVLFSSHPSLLEEGRADLWDSGKRSSARNHGIAYEGKPLSSGSKVYWKVRIWDAGDRASHWSDVTSFSTGMFAKEDWKASWIGLDRAIGNDRPDIENRVLSARYLRKEFATDKAVARAMAYIVGLGCHELYLNGQKVGDHVLSPALSEYPKRSYYVTHEVPIWENKEYDGEYYDARMEQTGWDRSGFDDTDWLHAEGVDVASPEVSSQMIEPMRITETIKPVAITQPEPGVFIFDMGQNMVGLTKLLVEAKAGKYGNPALCSMASIMWSLPASPVSRTCPSWRLKSSMMTWKAWAALNAPIP